MQEMIAIRPSLLRNFGDPSDCTFVVLTTPDWAPKIHVEELRSGYAAHLVTTAASIQEAHELISRDLPARSHILVVMPGVYFRSPDASTLGKHKKLGVLACYSTPTDVPALNHFLRQAERTDPGAQSKYGEFFFRAGQESEFLELRDEQYRARAVFNHLSDSLMWHEQIGALEWGEQQLLPSGEISVLPVDVFGEDISQALDVTGDLVLRGLPILHAGSVSFRREDQARLFDQLSCLRHGAIRLRCDHGHITGIDALDESAEPAARCFNMLREVDSRYGIVLEMGFGCNFTHELLWSNSAMNEVHGSPTGVLHLGFGLLPYTQYHLDVLCPQTRLLSSTGQDILGPRASLAT